MSTTAFFLFVVLLLCYLLSRYSLSLFNHYILLYLGREKTEALTASLFPCLRLLAWVVVLLGAAAGGWVKKKKEERTHALKRRNLKQN